MDSVVNVYFKDRVQANAFAILFEDDDIIDFINEIFQEKYSIAKLDLPFINLDDSEGRVEHEITFD
jgi:hypothetical protein